MKTNEMNIREKLSTLWIVVMLCMAFADIVGFMTPGALEQIIDQSAAPFPITQEIMLVFSVLIAIPIVMIYLSRVLNVQANRWANIIAGAITILFVAGLGSAELSYILFATIEVVCMLVIIRSAWQWPKEAILGNAIPSEKMAPTTR
ncbi:MAG: hypothetical protein GY943_30995 [Chloroflexi bacterium]|nr:hypothetical protein [Chloroflexota bacterium]